MKTNLRSVTLSTGLVALLSLFVSACTKTPESVAPVAATTSIGVEMEDSVVTSTVKAALLADPEVKSLDLQVETRKGEVQLSGFVDNQTQIDRASVVTRGVAGVKSVMNKTNLKGAPNTMGEAVDDVDITARVKTALLRDDNVKSFDIAVITRKGDAQLSGFVDNQRQMDLAVEVARGIEGVHSVHNEMSIKK